MLFLLRVIICVVVVYVCVDYMLMLLFVCASVCLRGWLCSVAVVVVCAVVRRCLYSCLLLV